MGCPLNGRRCSRLHTQSRGMRKERSLGAEPGMGGWRASVGYLRITSNLGSAYSIRASLLRTNNQAWRVAPQSTFAEAEFQFMPLFVLGARLGGFVRIHGQGQQRGLLTADISLML